MAASDSTSGLPKPPPGAEDARASPVAHEQAQALLRQSEADLAEAQRVAKLGSWRFDLATHAVRWSKELYRIFDVEEQAFGGTFEAFLAGVHPDDRSRVLQAHDDAREGGKPFELEYRVVTHAGQVKTIREVGYALKDDPGKVVGLFGTAQDVTERKQAEEALQKTNARLQAILDASPIPIIGVTADGRIESWNAAAERVFGWSATEAIGHLCPGVPHEELEDYLAMVRRAMRGEPSLGLVRYRRKNGGSLLVCRVSAAPQRNAQGQSVGVTVLLEDVTGQAQAEAALRESEERLRLLDDNLPDSYVYQYTQEADGTPRFLYLSAGVERLHGVKAEPALRDASVLFRQIAPEQLSALAAAEAASLRDLSDFQMELRIRRADGQWRWLQLRSRPRRTPAEQVIWDGVASDITERKQVEEALRESQERFSSAFKNAAVGMALVAPEGRLLQANRALREHLGYSEAELLAATFQTLTHPDDLAKDLAYVRQMLAGEIQTYQMEKRYFHKSGDIVWGLLSVSLVRNSQGLPAYFISQIQDITEHKQAEAALRQSREQLRALLARLERLREEERTRMAREVHDVLGQLLTALKMDTSWCERRFTEITDEPLRRSLEEKVKATSRLADQMIETVQKISGELRPSLLDNIGLGAALQFEARQFQERTGIACQVSVPSETLPLEPDRATGIFRVFQELLTNVARHAQASRVAASLVQTAQQVTLEVKDNGRGIREDELRHPKSLGILGMAERASLMGGRIEIHATAGIGTTATLTIPAKLTSSV